MGSAALMPLNSTMIAVAIPAISADLGVTAAAATTVLVGAYLVAAIVLQSPGGKIGDRIGHWRLLGVGLVAVAAGTGAAAAASSLAVLGGARVLTAVGGAALVPAAVALMRLELPAERRSGAFGRFGAIMALAAAAGPLVGGELASLFGWRSLFLVNFPLVVVAAATILVCRPRQAAPPQLTSARFDWPGSLLLGAALTCLVTGLRAEGPVSVVLLAGTAALAVLFWWAERRAGDPVVDFGLFRRRAFSAGTAVIALQNLAMYALVFQLPIVFHAALDLGSNASGRLLIAMMLAMVVFSLASGRLS